MYIVGCIMFLAGVLLLLLMLNILCGLSGIIFGCCKVSKHIIIAIVK